MELSPLAREKLAQISELTHEEKVRLKHSQHLASALSDYFTAKLSLEDLWKELKIQKEEGREFLLREAQLKLIDAINLAGSERDFDRQRRGILAVETLKSESNYTALEQSLDSIQNLRRQYTEGSKKTFREIKGKIEKQVRLAAQQLAAQAGTAEEIERRKAID
jgi:protein-disulfide isomerase-like protein with CxxC motif